MELHRPTIRGFVMAIFKSPVLAVGAMLALTACSPATPPAVDTTGDDAALKAATNTWIAAYNAGDVEKIVALYSDDAVLMPPHAAVARGHDGIRAFLTADTAGAKAAGIKIVNGTSTTGIAGDTWLYYRDTYNSDRPLPSPPAEKKSLVR
jgi:hypothetical protein